MRTLVRRLLFVLAVMPPAGSAMSSELAPLKDCAAGLAVSSAEVLAARDGMTLRLKEGGEIRLAGIVTPTEHDGGVDAAQRAAAILDRLLAGKRIIVHAAPEPDRYSRLVAQVVADGAWVQAALLRAGMARVMPADHAADCTAALLDAEQHARKMRAGFWDSELFAIERASAVSDLTAAAGRFMLVEANVRRVGESGGRLYLDFGRRFTEDFTIVIPRAAQPAFAAAGMDLRGLAGKRVRARGVLFFWGGPAMELHNPAALELLGTVEG